MVKKKVEQTKAIPDDVTMLDDLIGKCYSELSKSETLNAKLGDLVKMIELKRKLAPGGSEQAKFWKMLEKIRIEALAESLPPNEATKKPTKNAAPKKGK